MMKVAVISPTALECPPQSYGGAEIIAYLTAKYLAEFYDVALIAAKGSKAPKGCGLIETVEPKFSSDSEIKAYEVYKERLYEFDAIVDHTHFFPAYRAKLNNPELKVIKVVHDLRPWPSPPPEGSYDVIAGVSKWHAGHLSHVYATRFYHVYNAVEPNNYIFRRKKDDFLLFLNRLNPGKGAHIFVDICNELGIRGLVCGDDNPLHGIDPRYRDYVMKKCIDSDCVEYYGLIPHELKLELLSRAKAVVTPLNGEYREVFGLWILDACASGAPVFTTDMGAPAEILCGREWTPYGYVAQSMDELKSAIREFVEGEVTFDSDALRDRAFEFLPQMVGAYMDLLGV